MGVQEPNLNAHPSDIENRPSEELQVGAAGVKGQEDDKGSGHGMDDAEHDLESVRARVLNAASEFLSTASTRGVLDRDDAAAAWAEPPLTDNHGPESRRVR